MSEPATKHTFELAPSGRSKCRSCSQPIAKGELRFGERLPNLFGEGDMTHWHHPACAAHRRPEPLAEALSALDYPGADGSNLQAVAEHAQAHRRLVRLGKAERASSGRARCRSCRELIDKDTWRLPLIFFEEGTYSSSGFIHIACARSYCETDAVWDTIACFGRELDAGDLAELQAAI